MASVSEARLLEDVSRAGSSRSLEDDNDPRLMEQPQSAIATNATGADMRRRKRKAPELSPRVSRK